MTIGLTRRTGADDRGVSQGWQRVTGRRAPYRRSRRRLIGETGRSAAVRAAQCTGDETVLAEMKGRSRSSWHVSAKR